MAGLIYNVLRHENMPMMYVGATYTMGISVYKWAAYTIFGTPNRSIYSKCLKLR